MFVTTVIHICGICQSQSDTPKELVRHSIYTCGQTFGKVSRGLNFPRISSRQGMHGDCIKWVHSPQAQWTIIVQLFNLAQTWFDAVLSNLRLPASAKSVGLLVLERGDEELASIGILSSR